MRSTSSTSTRRATRSRTDRYRYVYCIIPSRKEEDFGEIGIEGSRVGTLHYRDLAAVVSPVSAKKLEVLDYGITHQRVVEEIRSQFPVLPMGFGQISLASDVKAFMSANYRTMTSLLRDIDGKSELGLKIFWNRDAIFRELLRSNEKIRILNLQISETDPDRAFKLKYTLGQLVARELERRGKAIQDEVYGILRPLSHDMRINKNLTEDMILNAAFLVDHTREAEFDQAVDGIENRLGDVVTMKYVVSPPYNFVNLRISGRR